MLHIWHVLHRLCNKMYLRATFFICRKPNACQYQINIFWIYIQNLFLIWAISYGRCWLLGLALVLVEFGHQKFGAKISPLSLKGQIWVDFCLGNTDLERRSTVVTNRYLHMLYPTIDNSEELVNKNWIFKLDYLTTISVFLVKYESLENEIRFREGWINVQANKIIRWSPCVRRMTQESGPGFYSNLEKAILVTMTMACSSGPKGDYECPPQAVECPKDCFYGIQCSDSYFKGGLYCYCFEPDR